MERIAIVGSRNYPRLDLVTRILFGILEPKRHIITGDAQGVDATVADWCSRLARNPCASHTLEVHRANWSRHGKAAGPIRNSAILQHAQAIIAFWDMTSPGTHQILELASQRDLVIYTYDPAGRLLPQQPSLFGEYQRPYLPDMSGPEYLPLDNPENPDNLRAASEVSVS